MGEVFFKIVAGAGDDDEVDIDEFVYGAMALKGPATGLDVRGSLHESARISSRLCEMDQAVNARLDTITRGLQQVILAGGPAKDHKDAGARDPPQHAFDSQKRHEFCS